MTQRHIMGCAAAFTILASSAVIGRSAPGGFSGTDHPETVVVTLHARAGSEAELAAVIARHWATARRLNLVLDAPHLTVRGSEDGSRTYFVDIFTWRDASVPDHAPAEIRAIWADMNRLVESRGAQPGLAFAEVTIVENEDPTKKK
jgi:hypothetical protein